MLTTEFDVTNEKLPFMKFSFIISRLLSSSLHFTYGYFSFGEYILKLLLRYKLHVTTML
jgi:hypothetical protein